MGLTTSELIRSVKGYELNEDKFIRLEDIKTKEDLDRINELGFICSGTISDFKKEYPNINTEHIYLEKSDIYGVKVVYLNLNKYIYKEFPMVPSFEGVFSEKEIIEMMEIFDRSYENKDINTLIFSAPDGFRFTILFRMFKDNFIPENEIYETFKEVYTSCDFGFENLSIEDYKFVFSKKQQSDIDELNKFLETLEDEVIVYRGEGEYSLNRDKDTAISYTLDINVANLFANRLSSKGSRIIKGVVKKGNIKEYIDDRSEKEVLVLPEDVTVLEIQECYGLPYINELDERLLNKYGIYKTLLKDMKYNNLKLHGKEHSLRVLFLTLLIEKELKRGIISPLDLELLCIAAINHDRGRTNEIECSGHGKKSFKLFMKDSSQRVILRKRGIEFDEDTVNLLEFLMTYHCIDDAKAREYLVKNNMDFFNMTRYLNLLNILKDADALDRVRMGFNELDINYLRLKESKRFLLMGKLLLKNLKL